MAHWHVEHTEWPKMAQFLYALTSSNINRFSKKSFYCQNQKEIYNNTITKNPTKRGPERRSGAFRSHSNTGIIMFITVLTLFFVILSP